MPVRGRETVSNPVDHNKSAIHAANPRKWLSLCLDLLQSVCHLRFFAFKPFLRFFAICITRPQCTCCQMKCTQKRFHFTLLDGVRFHVCRVSVGCCHDVPERVSAGMKSSLRRNLPVNVHSHHPTVVRRLDALTRWYTSRHEIHPRSRVLECSMLTMLMFSLVVVQIVFLFLERSVGLFQPADFVFQPSDLGTPM